MAKNTVAVSQNWVQVATGVVIIKITKTGQGAILFNESASDTNADVSLPGVATQFTQNETKTTYVRANGNGWEILLDGVLS